MKRRPQVRTGEPLSSEDSVNWWKDLSRRNFTVVKSLKTGLSSKHNKVNWIARTQEVLNLVLILRVRNRRLRPVRFTARIAFFSVVSLRPKPGLPNSGFVLREVPPGDQDGILCTYQWTLGWLLHSFLPRTKCTELGISTEAFIPSDHALDQEIWYSIRWRRVRAHASVNHV